MAEKNTVLQMEFVNYEGKNVSIKLVDPKDDLTDVEVQNAMETINNLGAFVNINGPSGEPVSLKGAKIVETITNELSITVE